MKMYPSKRKMESHPLSTPTISTGNNASDIRKKTLSLCLFILGILQITSVIYTHIYIEPISTGWIKLKNEPWGITALYDYSIGSIFAVTYLWILNGPSLLYIPCRLYAILTPLLGNFVLMTYVSYTLFTTNTLLPRTLSSVSTKPVKVGLVYMFMFLSFIGVCVWAIEVSGFSSMKLDYKEQPWIVVTFCDNVVGLIFTTIFIMYREDGKGWWIWLIALSLFGNGVTMLYVLDVVKDSWTKGLDFGNLLLTQRASIDRPLDSLILPS